MMILSPWGILLILRDPQLLHTKVELRPRLVGNGESAKVVWTFLSAVVVGAGGPCNGRIRHSLPVQTDCLTTFF